MNKQRRINRKVILVVVSLVSVCAVMLMVSSRSGSPEGEPVVITFLGHTNGIGTDRPFALFTISNQWSQPVRWSGDWTEVDRTSVFTARIVNFSARIRNPSPSLPSAFPGPALKGGDSFVWAVGQPDGEAQSRWRLTLKYREHTFKSRWLDWAMRNPRVPVTIGPLVLVDPQKILSPTNQQRASSEWVPWKAGTQTSEEPTE